MVGGPDTSEPPDEARTVNFETVLSMTSVKSRLTLLTGIWTVDPGAGSACSSSAWAAAEPELSDRLKATANPARPSRMNQRRVA
jgi:hypothetical protein